MANRDPGVPYEPKPGLSAALPQDRKTLMQGQIGRSFPSLSLQLHHLRGNRLWRKVVQLNVDVTSLIKLPVGGGVAFRAVLSDGNLDLHNGPGCICEN